MKRIITTIAALTIAVASYGQRTANTFTELFWGESIYSEDYPSTQLFSDPSPTRAASDRATYRLIGDDVYICTINGTWMTVTGTRTFETSDVLSGLYPAVTTLGFSDGFGVGTSGDTKNDFNTNNTSSSTRELSMFISQPTSAVTNGNFHTITGTYRMKVLSGCNFAYQMPRTTVPGSLLINLITPSLALSSFDPSYVVGNDVVESPWIQLGFSGNPWDGGPNVDVTSNPNISVVYEYNGTTGAKMQLNSAKGFDSGNGIVADMNNGYNSISIVPTLVTDLGDIRIRTANAIGTLKIKAIVVGYAPTTSVGIAGLSSVVGLTPKDVAYTISGTSMPAGALQGYSSFMLNDPSSVVESLNPNSITGAAVFKMIGDGCATLTGMAVDNHMVKSPRVLCSVKITSSVIAGATSLAIAATSTFSVSGITPTNAASSLVSTSWMSSNTAAATINASTGVLTGVANGVTTITAKHILFDNTTVTSGAIVVNVGSTSTASALDAAQFLIAPNPTNDVVAVSSSVSVSGIKVLALSGNEVASSNSSSVSLSNVPAGTYILAIQSANGVVYKKVVKL